jgi:hypothetical protein
MKFLIAFILACGVIMGDSPARAHSSHSGPRPFPRWCEGRLAVLDQAEGLARKLYITGRHAEALQALQEGLREAASQVNSRYRTAITVNAVLRGVDLMDELTRATAGDVKQVRTLLVFGFEYYEFIHNVAEKLDIPYFEPAPCGYCNVDVGQWESDYVSYSQQQVQMLLNRLTSQEYYGGYLYYHSLGTPSAFLKALELTTEYLAADLDYTLIASRYSCVVGDLTRLSRKLSRYNGPGKAGYLDDADATNSAANEAQEIINQIAPCN